VMRPVLDALAQHVNHAALGDLALQAGQELTTGRAVVIQVQAVSRCRLWGAQEDRQVDQIYRILTVGNLGGARNPSALGWEPVIDDERLQALLAEVGTHAVTSSTGSSEGNSTLPNPPNASSSSDSSGSSASLGKLAAASRTSSLPVTTSPI